MGNKMNHENVMKFISQTENYPQLVLHWGQPWLECFLFYAVVRHFKQQRLHQKAHEDFY